MKTDVRAMYVEKLKIGEEVLYLSEQDCIDTGVSKEELVEATEKGMIEYARGDVEMPAKIGIHPQPLSLMHAMPAYLPNADACGIKWGSNFPGNKKNYPECINTNCQIIFNDTNTGLPLAIMDATWITEVRTPATALISLKYTSDLNARSCGMLGCGIQGVNNVRMLELLYRELEEIYIYDRAEEAMDHLIEVCRPEVKAQIIKCKSCKEVIDKTDIVISALPVSHEPDPQVKAEWIRKGQTLMCLDLHSTYEDAVYRNGDKYYCDSIAQMQAAVDTGYIPDCLPRVTGEVGALADGRVEGRTNREEIIVIVCRGMAVEDMMCAKLIFEKALEKGIGIKLPLWKATGHRAHVGD